MNSYSLSPQSASISLEKAKDPSKELGASLVYNPYWIPCHSGDVSDHQKLCVKMDGYAEASPIVRAIIREYVNQKKIVGSFSLACKLICSNTRPGITITEDDVTWAYAIAAGGGMEYEWPYE